MTLQKVTSQNPMAANGRHLLQHLENLKVFLFDLCDVVVFPMLNTLKRPPTKSRMTGNFPLYYSQISGNQLAFGRLPSDII